MKEQSNVTTTMLLDIHCRPGAKYMLKGPKREKLHAMHVKELIKTNYFER